MCGIVGCVAASGAVRLILKGLQRLEYRGYDSAGLAVIDGESLLVRRREGKIANLEESLYGEEMKGGTGLGHTRWATHGPPTEDNAHPHRDCSGNLVIVHNGIIENYMELREMLVAKGHRFTSETDSEVLAHIIEDHLEGDLVQAVLLAIQQVEGAYAMGVLDLRTPELLVGVRRDSPLVVGLGEGENFIASDIPALLDYTRKFHFLDNDEIVVVNRNEVKVLSLEGKERKKEVEEISWNLLMTEKGGYKHFMLKEIFEQPQMASNTLMGRLLEEQGEVHLEGIALEPTWLKEMKKISFVACGTSYHAALVGKFYLERYLRIPVEVEIASEFRYRDPVIDPHTLLIAISQSGETADTLAALRLAKDRGAQILGICNVLGSSLNRESEHFLLTRAGPEIGVASTKAFTTQLLAIYLIALHLGKELGQLPPATLREKMGELRRIPHCIEDVLKEDEAIKDLADRYFAARNFLFIGRGVNFPIALEGALKLKEISYIHAEGYPAGEMKHGPIALIDDNMPVVAIATPGSVYEKILSNIEEAKARGGRLIGLACRGDATVPKRVLDTLFVPKVQEEFSPLVNCVALQLLAYHIASRRGCDIDQPRNLAKSVTVE